MWAIIHQPAWHNITEETNTHKMMLSPGSTTHYLPVPECWDSEFGSDVSTALLIMLPDLTRR